MKKPSAPKAAKAGASDGGKGERRPRGDDDEETGGEELEAGEQYAGESDDGDDGRSADGGDDGDSGDEGGEDGEVVDAAAELVDEDEIGDDDREAVSRPGGKRAPADDSVALSRSDPLQAYLREVQRHSLLTPEEEKSLAVRYAETQDVVAARRP